MKHNCATCYWAKNVYDDVYKCTEGSDTEIIDSNVVEEECDYWAEEKSAMEFDFDTLHVNSWEIYICRDSILADCNEVGVAGTFSVILTSPYQDTYRSSWSCTYDIEAVVDELRALGLPLTKEQSYCLEHYLYRFCIDLADHDTALTLIRLKFPQLLRDWQTQYVEIHGCLVDWETAVAAMQDDIREAIHNDGYDTPQEFADEYASRDRYWMRSDSDYLYDRI